jgi:hypothetical protein
MARCVSNMLQASLVLVVDLRYTYGTLVVCVLALHCCMGSPPCWYCWVLSHWPDRIFWCGDTGCVLTERASYIKTLFGHGLLLAVCMSGPAHMCGLVRCRPAGLVCSPLVWSPLVLWLCLSPCLLLCPQGGLV